MGYWPAIEWYDFRMISFFSVSRENYIVEISLYISYFSAYSETQNDVQLVQPSEISDRPKAQHETPSISFNIAFLIHSGACWA